MPVKSVSRNYQNFQRKTLELAFSGTSKDEVLDWLERFEQAGVANGVTAEEVVTGLSQFMTGHARANFNEQERVNRGTGAVCDWLDWKAWLSRVFNPNTKIL